MNAYKPDSVSITEMASSHTILVVAGPRSRELLQSVSPRTDWSREAFPWMRCKHVYLGHARALAMSVSFSGELAWELHIPNEQLLLAWNTLQAAGQDKDLVKFGLYATESMRVEKGYLHWKADIIYEHNPLEAGLDRFVNLDKPWFVGKKALLRQIERGPRKCLVSVAVQCDFASAHGGDPVFSGDTQVGSVTSSGYGHRTGINYAMAYVQPEFAGIGSALEVGILGERYAATVIAPCQYDPENERVRA